MEKKSTKQALIEAALEQISVGGLSQLSMRRLAGQVNVTATTIYRHFENKEELVQAILKLLRRRLKTGLYEGLSDQPIREKIFLVLSNLSSMLIRRRELLSLRPSKSENLPTIEDASYLEDIDTLKKWHELLEEGISAGIIVALPYYQLDALTIGALKACISDPAFREKEFKAPDFIDSLWKAIATPARRGLLPSESKNLLKEEAKKE